jgi:hypothetical protein
LYAFRFESAFGHLITAAVFAGAAIYLAYLLLPLPEYARANLGVFFYALWFVDGFIAVTAMFLGFGGALTLATEAPAKRTGTRILRVPWDVPCSGERRFEIWPCRSTRGKLAVWQPNKPVKVSRHFANRV